MIHSKLKSVHTFRLHVTDVMFPKGRSDFACQVPEKNTVIVLHPCSSPRADWMEYPAQANAYACTKSAAMCHDRLHHLEMKALWLATQKIDKCKSLMPHEGIACRHCLRKICSIVKTRGHWANPTPMLPPCSAHAGSLAALECSSKPDCPTCKVRHDDGRVSPCPHPSDHRDAFFVMTRTALS